MEITLTPAQWSALKDLVIQGKRTERALGKPIELINSDQRIEIEANETKITLND